MELKPTTEISEPQNSLFVKSNAVRVDYTLLSVSATRESRNSTLATYVCSKLDVTGASRTFRKLKIAEVKRAGKLIDWLHASEVLSFIVLYRSQINCF